MVSTINHSRSSVVRSTHPVTERNTLNASSSSSTRGSKRDPKTYIVPIAILALAAALIVFALTTGNSDDSSGATPPGDGPVNAPDDDEAPGDDDGPSQEEIDESIAALADLAHHTDDDPLALGDDDAPVTIIIYSDFKCPYCGHWTRETMPQIEEQYVDSGHVRFEWRDMPVLGEESFTGALAGRAAANQGKFWEFTNKLYEEDWQENASAADYQAENLADIAEELGMDRDQFLADIDDDDIAAAVEEDLNEGSSIGFTGTPGFLVEGLPIMGAQEMGAFDDAIEIRLEELEEAQ